MSLLKRYEKGEYKYASYSKVRNWIITLVMYALSAAIYTIGYVTTGSNRNLLTIVAILGVLPASKSLIGAIMSSRVKVLNESMYAKIEDNEDAYINRLTQLSNSDQSVQPNEKLVNLLKNISV